MHRVFITIAVIILIYLFFIRTCETKLKIIRYYSKTCPACINSKETWNKWKKTTKYCTIDVDIHSDSETTKKYLDIYKPRFVPTIMLNGAEFNVIYDGDNDLKQLDDCIKDYENLI